MADDATLALLQEIRDLQKQQLEHLRASVANQQQSLANQQQSLSVQQQVVERQDSHEAGEPALDLRSVGHVFLVLSTILSVFLSSLAWSSRVSMSRLSPIQPVGSSISLNATGHA